MKKPHPWGAVDPSSPPWAKRLPGELRKLSNDQKAETEFRAAGQKGQENAAEIGGTYDCFGHQQGEPSGLGGRGRFGQVVN